MDEIEGNSFIEELIPESLLNKAKEPKYEGTRFWKAIDSEIGELELNEIENYYRHSLPDSFKFFLSYRHFLELNLGQHSVSFFKNLPNTIVTDIKEEIENYYEGLVERSYLPFASLGDYGVLCFDANIEKANHDYQIVSFDHEDEYTTPENYSPNFEEMFVEFESNLDDWIKRNRADKDTQ